MSDVLTTCPSIFTTLVDRMLLLIIILIFTADYGQIHYHIGFGGTFYVYTDITQFKLDIKSSPTSDIIMAAMKLKNAIAAAVPLSHPEHDDLAYLYGVNLYSGPLGSSSDSLTVFAEGQVSSFNSSYVASGCGSCINSSNYHIRQNFRVGKLSRLCTKYIIHWKTFAVHQAVAIMYCTQQVI